MSARAEFRRSHAEGWISWEICDFCLRLAFNREMRWNLPGAGSVGIFPVIGSRLSALVMPILVMTRLALLRTQRKLLFQTDSGPKLVSSFPFNCCSIYFLSERIRTPFAPAPRLWVHPVRTTPWAAGSPCSAIAPPRCLTDRQDAVFDGIGEKFVDHHVDSKSLKRPKVHIRSAEMDTFAVERCHLFIDDVADPHVCP